MGAALVLISCSNLYNSVFSWYDFLSAQKHWCPVQANIRNVVSADNPGKWNEPKIQFDFAVQGNHYVGKRIDIYDNGKGRKGIFQFLAQYEPGQRIIIYYDIRDPNRSAIQKPAFSNGMLLVIPLGNLLILLPLGLRLIKESLVKTASPKKPSKVLAPIMHYGIDSDLSIIENGVVSLEQALKIITQKNAENSTIMHTDCETVISKSMFGFSRSDDTFVEIAIGDINNFDVRIEVDGSFEKELHSIPFEVLINITKNFFALKPKAFKRFICEAPNRPVER